MKNLKKIQVLLPVILIASQALMSRLAVADTVSTRIGQVELTEGIPASPQVAEQLFDASDFQRAAQAYVWALPIVGFAQWQSQAQSVFGAKDTDMVLCESVKDKLGILTANATTPYIT